MRAPPHLHCFSRHMQLHTPVRHGDGDRARCGRAPAVDAAEDAGGARGAVAGRERWAAPEPEPEPCLACNATRDADAARARGPPAPASAPGRTMVCLSGGAWRRNRPRCPYKLRSAFSSSFYRQGRRGGACVREARWGVAKSGTK